MRIFRFCSLLLLLCGCQDVLSPQLRRLPVSEIREQGNKLVLNVSGRRVVLFKESSCAVIDGIPVQLCDAVQYTGSQWSLPENSVTDILLPLIDDSRIPVKKILLDPGHGGSDAGAVSAGGIKEKDLNLALAGFLEKELKKLGFQVIMTRTTDKNVSLADRAEMAVRCRAQLLVSLHHNSSARNPDAAGMETFALKSETPQESAMSRPAHRLAFLIQQEQSGLNTSPGRGVKHARFKVLRSAGCPAVLVEAGFISNPAELKKCASSEYQRLLAQTIARAVRKISTAK